MAISCDTHLFLPQGSRPQESTCVDKFIKVTNVFKKRFEMSKALYGQPYMDSLVWTALYG